MRVKCLAQEHNTMSPARARTRTARSAGDERNNDEATAPPKYIENIMGKSSIVKNNCVNTYLICVAYLSLVPILKPF